MAFAYKGRGRGRGSKPNMAQGRGRIGGGQKVGKVQGKPKVGGLGLGTVGKVQGKPTMGLGALGGPAPTVGPGAPQKPGLGGGPAAPAAPKPAAPRARPEGDSQYNDRIANVDRREEERLGELEGQSTAIEHEFGINDPTNPFSRAEGLKRAFLARQKGRSAGLASQGQLYSGAHERAMSRTRLEEEQARAELRSAYDQAQAGISSAERGVKWDTEEERRQAFEDWLQRQEDAPVAAPEDVVAPKPAAPGPKPGDIVMPDGTTKPNAAATEGPPKIVPGGSGGQAQPSSSGGKTVGTVTQGSSGIGKLPPTVQAKGQKLANKNRGQGQGKLRPKGKQKVKQNGGGRNRRGNRRR
jgi:hypothetical protein